MTLTTKVASRQNQHEREQVRGFACELSALSQAIDQVLGRHAASAALSAVAGLGLAFAPSPAQADTFTVNSILDNGDGTCDITCTLRDAVTAANNNAGTDTVDASTVTGTITLSGTQINITDELTLTGPGADQLIVDAGAQSRIFRAAGATSLTTISGLTLANGNVNSNPNRGGAIYAINDLDLNRVTVRDSEADYGGGFFVDSGNATVTRSTISGNTANIGGGFLVQTGDAAVTHSTVSGNTANNSGGGFFLIDGDATVTYSTISGNTATNNAGGFYVADGNATLTNSIVADNSANANEAFYVSNTLTATYSLVEGSSFPAVPNANGNLPGADPGLGLLADNGGPTYTHAIDTSSAAFNTGDPSFASLGSSPDYDQRGAPYTREVFDRLDMGAYEVQGLQTLPDLVVNSLADPGNGVCEQPPAGDCTLREAVNAANVIDNGPGTVDEITFASDLTGTINLNGEEITIADELTITGPGADRVTVDAGGQSRIFYATGTTSQTSISGLALTHGYSFFNGGAIFADNDLTLDGVAVRDSEAAYGAGFFVEGGATVTHSTFSGNSAISGAGFFALLGDATVTHSTFSGNSAEKNGGGFFAFSGDATVTYSTFTGNQVTEEGGGGFHVYSGDATLTHSIVANNSSPDQEAFFVSDNLNASYSLVEGDSSPQVPNANGNIPGVDPGLGPLHDNGGPTFTHAIDTNSAAFNAGDPNFTPPPAYDQRGAFFSRVVFGRLDMGAYELQDLQSGPDFVVNTLADPGDERCQQPPVGACTLREAVHAANELDDGPGTVDEITFASLLTGTITLSGRQINITDELTITGPGADQLILDAGAQSRIFRATGATSLTTISGLTLANGDDPNNGGAVYTINDLALNRVTVRDSEADYGGGFLVFSGDATVTRSTISGNTANLGGGFFVSTGDAAVTHSTVSGNTANNSGGGFFLDEGDATVTYSTISGNTATNKGGGFYVGSGNGTLTHSIVADNSANSNEAFYVLSNNLLVTFSLVEGDSSPPVTSATFNIPGVDPGLGPLADNGGPTYTQAIDTNSAAFNAGIPIFGPPPYYDQRGAPYSRVAAGRVDMGAYEYHAAAGGALIVNTLADTGDGFCLQPAEGDCTLREAVKAANDLDNGPDAVDEITFDSSLTGTITLSGTEIQITDELTVNGLGTDGITVDASNQSRIFNATQATSLTTLMGLTLANGYSAGNGGAVYAYNDLTLNAVTVRDSAAYQGGGFLAYSGDATVINSTVSGNTAVLGGGFYVTSGNATVIHSTVSGNTAYGFFGYFGFGGFAVGGNATLSHSIVADNTAPAQQAFYVLGNLTATYNLVEGASYPSIADGINGNITGADPQLGPLQDNGGPTPTQALMTGSPAIDAGTGTCPTSTDQRGEPRPADGDGSGTPECDLGAFEVQDSDGDGLPDNFETDNGLDPNDPGDADDDPDGDGLSNLEEFHAGSDLHDPDTDDDGLGDSVDEAPTSASNVCTGPDATFGPFTVNTGTIVQCAAANSITVVASLDIDSGGRAELYTPLTKIQTGFSVPLGAEFAVEATSLPAIASQTSAAAEASLDAAGRSTSPAAPGGLSGDGGVPGRPGRTVTGASVGGEAGADSDHAVAARGASRKSGMQKAATSIPVLSPLGWLLLPLLIPIAGWRYLRRRTT